MVRDGAKIKSVRILAQSRFKDYSLLESTVSSYIGLNTVTDIILNVNTVIISKV